jgi:hypothetical protein
MNFMRWGTDRKKDSNATGCTQKRAMVFDSMDAGARAGVTKWGRPFHAFTFPHDRIPNVDNVPCKGLIPSIGPFPAFPVAVG